MKKVVLIPDSFKGTMSSAEICGIMAQAIRAHDPSVEIVPVPVADGGEGTVDAFLTALGGEKITVPVQGPLGETVQGFYGKLGDIAFLEMAAAAGLPLVQGTLRPEEAGTYGVGQLMLHAAAHGARRLIVGLGGSATTDGGCGAAAAAGVRFLDDSGKAFVPVGGTLDRIATIDTSGLDRSLKAAEIVTMCDISNPLTGPQGAACVFAPQKGADAGAVQRLDHGLAHLAELVRTQLGVEIDQVPGAGAAGGMGGGMIAWFGSRLEMGIQVILDTVQFDQLIRDADLILTGEGKIDSQSLGGKVVIGVARRARRQNVPVIAVVGDIDDPVDAAYQEGVTGIFSINRVAVPYAQAKHRAKEDLYRTVDNLWRVFTGLPKS